MKTSQMPKPKAYFDGRRDEARRWAWWKDGEQQVGTCGTTLRKALAEIDEEERQELESVS